MSLSTPCESGKTLYFQLSSNTNKIIKVHVELQYLYNLDSWCNGSTSDFGSLSIGSSPVESTNHLHLKINNLGSAMYIVVWRRENWYQAVVFIVEIFKRLSEKLKAVA